VTEWAEPPVSPGGGEQVAVDPPEGGQSHGDGHDDGEHAQQLLSEGLERRTTDGHRRNRRTIMESLKLHSKYCYSIVILLIEQPLLYYL